MAGRKTSTKANCEDLELQLTAAYVALEQAESDKWKAEGSLSFVKYELAKRDVVLAEAHLEKMDREWTLKMKEASQARNKMASALYALSAANGKTRKYNAADTAEAISYYFMAANLAMEAEAKFLQARRDLVEKTAALKSAGYYGYEESPRDSMEAFTPSRG